MLRPIPELEVLCRAAEDSWLGTTFESSLSAMQARELGRGALGLAREGHMGSAIHTARSAVALEQKHLGDNGPWALFLAALEKAFMFEACPAVPRLKGRGRPRKTTATIEKPESAVDGRIKAKAIEACSRYLDLYPRGGHLARWFREGQQDLRATELQALARGDQRTADVAAQLQALGAARSKVHAALALPRDFGRVKPESAP